MATHHHIVVLQGDFVQFPHLELPAPHSCTKTSYPQTSLSDLHTRVHDASILVISLIKLDAITLSPEITPNLKLIVVVATGTDCVDLDACRKRGIVVSNSPAANSEAVSEHAIGLYFMIRKKMLDMHMMTQAGEWARKTLMFQFLDKDGIPPLTCQEEVAGVIGNGNVGKRIASLARGLGMKVLVSGRRDPSNPSPSTGSDKTEKPFDTVIKQSTVLFLAVPLTELTRNLISTSELDAMSPGTVLVNVSRGGVVDEEELLKALREGKIAGAATDVFSKEPAGTENSPLLGEENKDLNLVTTPHLAWLAKKTLTNQTRMLKEAIEGWVGGEAVNVVC